jgi:hypothetical protein
LREGLRLIGIEIRAGLHTGEVKLRGADIGGIAANLARRVCDSAAPGELRVSESVVLLIAGSGLEFDDLGPHDLAGVPGKWRLYSRTRLGPPGRLTLLTRRGGGMDASERAGLLAEVDFFKGCTQRQIDDIAKLVSSRELSAGEILCRQGDYETDVFVLVDGEASVEISGKQVATVGKGEVVGELSMERGGHRTATLTALTPIRVLVLDPREVDSVLAADPSSAANLGPRHPGPPPG